MICDRNARRATAAVGGGVSSRSPAGMGRQPGSLDSEACLIGRPAQGGAASYPAIPFRAPFSAVAAERVIGGRLI